MKSRKIWFISGIAAGALATLAVRHFISLMPCGIRPARVAWEASSIGKWINAWANDHHGDLPASLEELKSRDYGVEADFLTQVIEYNGAGKNLNSLDKDFVVLRCRSESSGKLEALLYADGRVVAAARE